MKNSSEEKLILLCSRIEMDSGKQKEISDLLKTFIDWAKIINLSSYHGVIPLLYYNLNKSQFLNYIDKEAFRLLQETYLFNLLRNRILWRELSKILIQIRQAKIKAILFKGIILAPTIYRNPTLRVFTDIDVLVKDEDLSRLRNILIERGYKEIKQRNTILFKKSLAQEINAYLELHTMLVPPRPYKIQIPLIWQRAEEKIIYDQKVDCLSKEDNFLSLVLHIRRHTRYLPLRFICDIAELLNLYKDTFDWEYIQDIAEKNHIKNTVYFCLYISKELLDAPISEEVINRFNPGLFKEELIYSCMNKRNFLKPRIWQGYILRLLLFDRVIDLFIYGACSLRHL